MKTSQVDAVICWHTDRLYPSMKDLERLIEIAEAARISIRTNAVQTGLSSFSRICWSGRRRRFKLFAGLGDSIVLQCQGRICASSRISRSSCYGSGHGRGTYR